MTKYRALTQSYHDNHIVEPGDVVDFADDVKVHTNYELADRTAAKAKPEEKGDVRVDALIEAVKLHAATRGVPPTDVNEFDFDAVSEVSVPKPTPEIVKAAAKKLGVVLGSSVA